MEIYVKKFLNNYIVSSNKKQLHKCSGNIDEYNQALTISFDNADIAKYAFKENSKKLTSVDYIRKMNEAAKQFHCKPFAFLSKYRAFPVFDSESDAKEFAKTINALAVLNDMKGR